MHSMYIGTTVSLGNSNGPYCGSSANTPSIGEYDSTRRYIPVSVVFLSTRFANTRAVNAKVTSGLGLTSGNPSIFHWQGITARRYSFTSSPKSILTESRTERDTLLKTSSSEPNGWSSTNVIYSRPVASRCRSWRYMAKRLQVWLSLQPQASQYRPRWLRAG